MINPLKIHRDIYYNLNDIYFLSNIIQEGDIHGEEIVRLSKNNIDELKLDTNRLIEEMNKMDIYFINIKEVHQLLIALENRIIFILKGYTVNNIKRKKELVDLFDSMKNGIYLLEEIL